MKAVPMKAGVAILISGKIDFREKNRDTEGRYIMIKGSIHQADIAKLNVTIPNNSANICETKTNRTERRNDKFIMIEISTLLFQQLTTRHQITRTQNSPTSSTTRI